MSTAHDPQNHKKIQQPVASLLEGIFLYLANLALPRSCPSLGAKLSSKTTRLRLFMIGFHDTWDQYFGIPMSQEGFNWSDIDNRFKDDFYLRSDLLSMPWVDIDFILEAHLWGSADVHSKVRIPVDLITGPWDEEKKRRLFWLVRAGGHLMDPETESPWEVRLAGIDAAVITPEKPDPLVLKCLITPMICIGLPPDAAHNRIIKMCRRIARGVDTQDMIQMLRLLVRELHGDQKFMSGYSYGDEDADFVQDDEFYDKLYIELVEEGVEYEGWGT
ncbi:hypothetical protein E4U61_005129 [Claviceps capensis]|nr:hypothetical protein E4U61_005129 [Claviceps capensis]